MQNQESRSAVLRDRTTNRLPASLRALMPSIPAHRTRLQRGNAHVGQGDGTSFFSRSCWRFASAINSATVPALMRRPESAGADRLMVAVGRAELIVDPVVAVWDLAALLPVIEEAGGTFTDWQGRRTIHSGQSIATNGHVFEEVLEIVRG